MSLLLTFYGDDFTGSTDALEQLNMAGIQSALFTSPPTAEQMRRFDGLQAIGVAGRTRALRPKAMTRELRPAFQRLKDLRPRHVHYKVCSTFDSSPDAGNLGTVIALGFEVFQTRFIPILAAAPALGRFTVFGNHFAQFGIGSGGEIHRLDRHPSVSRHPITPMREADLRLHLARQTKEAVGLFDVLKLSLPMQKRTTALEGLLAAGARVVLFDALTMDHVERVGELMDAFASEQAPMFSMGSSAIETALASMTSKRPRAVKPRRTGISAGEPVLVASGSCSPVTLRQIRSAVRSGFVEVPLDVRALGAARSRANEIVRASNAALAALEKERSVVIHTTRHGRAERLSSHFPKGTAEVLGNALGSVLRNVLAKNRVHRVCLAGGDTSSYAARALGLEALEMIAPLTPGAPLCRARAPGSPLDGREVVFKGGQVGVENYFEQL
ncbi:MAG TPA: four-carbon acid sugar kinase family protein [Verrucomicrobiae bacterium]|nr:four-carbon acid sugar kinase family protein [Verrucomicrobiae bacterium]